jgi:hypothetical protein
MAIPDSPAPLDSTQPSSTGVCVPPGPQTRPEEAGPPKEAGAAPGPRRRSVLLPAALVLALAFLAASFPVRNADFWFHLAGGRLLAEGKYHFGVDPFSYTTAGAYWANHAWLYDYALHALYFLVGGAGLVVLKALLVTALGVLMLLVRRPGGPGGVPAACTALALLVMSPRLLLQPVCLSYFFLGLTLWLLWRGQPDDPRDEAGPPSRRHLLLPIVFALWVNVDEWFWLGPLLAALFWVGGRLRGGPRTPGWLVPAGLAACLLNPHGYHAFTLPAELSPVLWESGLQQDVRFRRLFSSPWQVDLFTSAAAGVNLAAWAYFVLVGLGLASFTLLRKNLSGWRLPVWLAFGVLGAWQVRTLPFFAVVAGPVTALNLQDALAARPARRAGQRSWAPALAHAALVAALLALVGLAGLGSLQGWGVEGRKVAWAVQPDPSLRRVAQTLLRWRQQGRLAEGDRVFGFHPDVVHYCAWFCYPEEVKGFFDHRLPLFPEVARVYEEACRDLNPAVGAGREKAARADGGWREVFRKDGVTHLVLYDPDPRNLLAAVSLPDWVLLRVDGQALVYGWKQGRAADRLAKDRFDADRLAFGPVEEGEDAPLPPAPGPGPGRGPRPPRPWVDPGRPAPLPAWESAAANVFLRLYGEATPGDRLEGKARGLGTLAAGLVGLPAQPGGPLAFGPGIDFRVFFYPLFVAAAAERPPALPLLTVRAARRALAEDPQDSNAYLRLAEAYRILRDETCERSREERLPPLAMLRHVQVVTALEQALVLNPDLEAAHQHLADLYYERRYLDLSLEHRRALLALARRRKTRPGEAAEEQAHRLAQLEDQVLELETFVGEQQNKYAVAAEQLRDNPLRRAQLALGLGLARTALDDVLLKSRVLLFGTEGAKLELELLLATGRVEEARGKLEDEEMRQSRETLGFYELPGADASGRPAPYELPAYEWLRCCQAAATGDYDLFAAELEQVTSSMERESRQRLRDIRRALPQAVGKEVVYRVQHGLPVPYFLAHTIREEYTKSLAQTFRLQAAAADLEVLAGVVALERGQPAAARRHLEQALAHCPPGSDPDPYFAGRPIAQSYLPRLKAAGAVGVLP